MPVNANDFDPEFLQPKPAAKHFGVSKSVIQQLITDGKVESFLLRRHADSRNGVRLVKISSVRAYFEKQAAEYAKAKAAGELPVIAERGREVRKANLERRRALRETKKQLAEPSV
jgi:hypothetical protein